MRYVIPGDAPFIRLSFQIKDAAGYTAASCLFSD